MFWFMIILFTLLTGIIFGIIGFLIKTWWFKPQNNPNLATIYVEGISKPYKAFLAYSSSSGSLYVYNHASTFVVVPSSYRISYHNYRRDIWLDRSDNLIAIPIGNDKNPPNQAKNELLQELFESHIGSEAIHAIKSKSQVSMLMIIVIVVVVIFAGVGGYALHKPKTIIQEVPTTQTMPKIENPSIQIGGQ